MNEPPRPPQNAEEVYDAYLDACLEGSAVEPAAFADAHGADGELRARLEELYRFRVTQDTRTGEIATADAIPGFRLIEEIQSGGMGSVWLAEERALGRRVALKRIHPQLLASSGMRERFEREARSIARLEHPHIVGIHAFGETEDGPWFAMEWIDGTSLGEVLAAEERPPWRTAVTWARDAARALAHAHAAGVVHRDVKPDNLLVDRRGTIKLVDFGIARDDAAGAGLTQTYHGSPLYSAPEQLMGQPLDARCDVYGLGAVLYEALTGLVPFAGRGMEDVVRRALTEEPLPPRRLDPSLPRDLETVTLRALEKDAVRRYGSARAFADDLDAVLAGRSPVARPPGPVRRSVRALRRHPRLLLALGLVLLIAGALLVRDAVSARERQREADRLLAEAAAGIDAIADLHDEHGRARSRLETLRSDLVSKYLDAAHARELLALDARAGHVAQQREDLHRRILVALRQAEDLGADRRSTRAVEARLYSLRLAKAEQRGAEARFWQDRLAELDPEAPARRARSAFTLLSDPPRAHVEIWPVRAAADLQPEGERRLVPAPHAASWLEAPGTWVLEVLKPAAPVEAGDLIVALADWPVRGAVLVSHAAAGVERFDRLVRVDGRRVLTPADARPKSAGVHTFEFEAAAEGREETAGRSIREVTAPSLEARSIQVADAATIATSGGVDAEVLRAGKRVRIHLPPGLAVRMRAAHPLGPGRLLGPTPQHVTLPSLHGHLLRLTAPGCRPTWTLLPPTPNTPIRLEREGEARAGFVYVPGQPHFWIQEHEVTCQAYLRFLNDPATRALVDATEAPTRYPRQAGRCLLEREERGVFRLPGDWHPTWPVFGVSYEDAKAYATWRTRVDGLTQARYALPTIDEWRRAAGAETGRRYPYGDWFWPQWMNTNFSRYEPGVEAVMSYPIDCSPFGAYDMGGSVAEWLASVFPNLPTSQRLGGASWGHAEAKEAQIENSLALPPHLTTTMVGFRLVLRPAQEAEGR